MMHYTVHSNVNLKPYNTFGISAIARSFVEYSSENQLINLLKNNTVSKDNILHIGGGSNLLFVKPEIHTVLHSKIDYITKTDCDSTQAIFSVGAGVIWDKFCAHAVEKGYWGAENLSHIPGEVGASAVQNIGAYGVEACDIIHSVRAINIHTLEVETFSCEQCNYSYRTSIFKTKLKGQYIITEVNFLLTCDGKPNLEYSGLKERFTDNTQPSLEQIRSEIIKLRDSKLPSVNEFGSAGSFFKNPILSKQQFLSISAQYPNIPHYPNSDDSIKISAGWMIDKCGLKGKEYRGAAVYYKQALVIINKGSATGKDIAELSALVQQTVKEKFGIDIEPEVQFI